VGPRAVLDAVVKRERLTFFFVCVCVMKAVLSDTVFYFLVNYCTTPAPVGKRPLWTVSREV
jgi:hypothetical protein